MWLMLENFRFVLDDCFPINSISSWNIPIGFWIYQLNRIWKYQIRWYSTALKHAFTHSLPPQRGKKQQTYSSGEVWTGQWRMLGYRLMHSSFMRYIYFIVGIGLCTHTEKLETHHIWHKFSNNILLKLLEDASPSPSQVAHFHILYCGNLLMGGFFLHKQDTWHLHVWLARHKTRLFNPVFFMPDFLFEGVLFGSKGGH